MGPRFGLGLLGMVAPCALAVACGSAPRPAQSAPPAKPSATVRGGATRLSALGCSVELPGTWAEPELDDGLSWSAQASDREDTVAVIRLHWKVKVAGADAKEFLASALGLRHEADRDSMPGVVASPDRFLELGTESGAYYTAFDPKERSHFVTLARAQSLDGCVVIVSHDETDAALLEAYARSALSALRIEP